MIKLVKELLSLRDQILKHLKDIYIEYNGEREELINEVKESLKFGHEVRQKLLEYKKNRFNNTNNKKKQG